MAKDLSELEAAQAELDELLSWGAEATETPQEIAVKTVKVQNTSIISGLKKTAAGTPIISGGDLPKKRGRPVGSTKAVIAEAAEKSGRGRPRSRTLDFSRIPTTDEKIAMIKEAIVTAYGDDFLAYLIAGKHIDIVITANDGMSICDRVRVYIGQEHSGCHARSMAKGRGRCTERKGVYPIIKLVDDILSSYHSQWIKAK